jgi:hypothetical protein
MAKKKRFKMKCECGKEIVGFSEKHVKINLYIHKKHSIRHKEIIKILKEKEL